ncbi:MAG: putative inorganic carbon transporter subunit DabA [Dermatophilaceae bacterium]
MPTILASVLVPLVLLVAALVVPLLRPGAALTVGAPVAALSAVVVVASGVLDTRSAVLLLFTTALTVVVAAFSRRHLDGDVDRPRYDRMLLLTTAAAVLVVTTSDLLLLLAGWLVTGWGLTGLVGHHQRLATTRSAVDSLRRARLVGDIALTVAVGILVIGARSTSIADVTAWAAAGPLAPLAVAALALAVAAGARSGLLPFIRWLPLSVVAPAPVSALLHAGIANAPVVLLIALEPVWNASPVIAWGLLGYALTSAVLTFPRLLVRADAKTRLAWSTTGQLAFMLALVAAGAYVAALAHMMLHGVYKALAFLWAGAEVSRGRADRLPGTSRRTRVVGAVLGLLLVGAAVAADAGWQHPVSGAALLAAGAAGGYGLFSLRSTVRVRVLAAAVALGSVGVVLVAVRGLAELLDLPVDADGPRAWTAAAVIAAYAAAGVWLRTRRSARVWARLHRAADPARAPRRRMPVPASLGQGSTGRAPELRAAVIRAATAVPPTWNWSTFIATNPLLGEEHRPFADAVRTAAQRGWSAVDGVPASGGGRGASPTDGAIDDVLAGWLAAWTDASASTLPAPGRDLPFWQWVREVAVHDPVLGSAWRAALRGLPTDAAEALALLAPDLAVADAERWATDELLRLPGWAGYLSRRGTTAAALDAAPLGDLLAARAVLRLALGSPIAAPDPRVAPEAAADDVVPEAVRALAAREREVARPVLTALDGQTAPNRADADPGAPARRAADLVFCIDVRSEVLRRHLEPRGRYRTVGFAGFFGMPLRRECAGTSPTDRLPILLAPGATVREDPPRMAGVRSLLYSALRQALDTPGSGFGAVDIAALRGMALAGRVLAPSFARSAPVPTRPLHLDLEHQPQLLDAAVGLVRSAGLHGPATGRLVVLVGHGSTSTNNPAEAAFDCGACGGSRGGFNARVAAAVLGTEAGRAAVADAGLRLPIDAVLVAAEHDTATDRVRILDREAVPATHAADLADLEAHLAAAGAATAAERARLLPGARSGPAAASALRRRALDPGEVRHEWGLAGNAFFVAAPRSLTAGLDLQGRAFLHDYEPATDPTGALLELIMTAPVVVAHWINMQYVLSTADPEGAGSGSKTAHNPVGGIGVLSGATGDLRTGLAEQSVRHLGQPVHDPTRLCVILHAAPGDVDAVLERHPEVAALVTGEWLSVHVHEPATGLVLRRTPSGWRRSVDGSGPGDHVLDRPDSGGGVVNSGDRAVVVLPA